MIYSSWSVSNKNLYIYFCENIALPLNKTFTSVLPFWNKMFLKSGERTTVQFRAVRPDRNIFVLQEESHVMYFALELFSCTHQLLDITCFQECPLFWWIENTWAMRSNYSDRNSLCYMQGKPKARWNTEVSLCHTKLIIKYAFSLLQNPDLCSAKLIYEAFK